MQNAYLLLQYQVNSRGGTEAYRRTKTNWERNKYDCFHPRLSHIALDTDMLNANEKEQERLRCGEYNNFIKY